MAIRKICASCGGYNKESATFCDKCGQSNLIEQEVADAPEDGDISILINKSDNENLKKASQNATFMKYKMKWHDVLTAWFMYVWCVGNIANGIRWFSGSMFTKGSEVYGLSHGEALDLIYAAVPWLESAAIGFGIFSVVYGIACVVIRPMLRDLKKKGLYAFLGLMIVAILGNIGTVIMESQALQEMGVESTASSGTIIIPLVFACANIVYYAKRKSLFE
ncbi:MAG: hypothetical protein IJO09_01780 [Oscillospiraceae bacterium]|nr:hypothetical protein [Oscillospiraceae bacterium]